MSSLGCLVDLDPISRVRDGQNCHDIEIGGMVDGELPMMVIGLAICVGLAQLSVEGGTLSPK